MDESIRLLWSVDRRRFGAIGLELRTSIQAIGAAIVRWQKVCKMGREQ
jgi:hypothetical protein